MKYWIERNRSSFCHQLVIELGDERMSALWDVDELQEKFGFGYNMLLGKHLEYAVYEFLREGLDSPDLSPRSKDFYARALLYMKANGVYF